MPPKDSSLLALGSKRELLSRRAESESEWNPLKSLGFGSMKQKDPPTAPPKEYLLFNWDAGGAWDGDRNDLDAEVGFEWKPLKDFNITAVGRHVAGHYDQIHWNESAGFGKGGRNLFEKANVSIWFVVPEGMKLAEGKDPNVDLKLLSVEVGPEDKKEVGGKYNFKYLDEPFPIYAHKHYRITQTSHKGMRDVWFDGVADDSDWWAYGLPECVEVLEGVHSDKKHHYPDRMEHKHRRMGMLNFRLESEEGCGIVMPVNAKENAGTGITRMFR